MTKCIWLKEFKYRHQMWFKVPTGSLILPSFQKIWGGTGVYASEVWHGMNDPLVDYWAKNKNKKAMSWRLVTYPTMLRTNRDYSLGIVNCTKS